MARRRILSLRLRFVRVNRSVVRLALLVPERLPSDAQHGAVELAGFANDDATPIAKSAEKKHTGHTCALGDARRRWRRGDFARPKFEG